MNQEELIIDAPLVRRLIEAQFPHWKGLPIRPVSESGWDNKTFHLGSDMLVRMPSSAEYEPQVEKEHLWLPRLKPFLPLPIPEPLTMGQPDLGYPWSWLIYRYLKGDAAASTKIADLNAFAKSLGQFLKALHHIDTHGGPKAGLHSFYRGGPLSVYDAETRKAIRVLKGKIDAERVLEVWEEAINSFWQGNPVWVHGDLSTGNLLVNDGKLCGVIDFGQLAIGDPACDLAIAWTLFKGKSRETFQAMLALDKGTWSRGRAWTLWKALIVAAGFTNPNNKEALECWRIIDEVLSDHMEMNS